MKKAVLVGVNQYETQKSLRGCLNDVNEMKKILIEIFNFDEISELINEQVTKESVISEISRILQVLPEENDSVRVIFFAGHGGRTFDKNGEEIDEIDETICMKNYSWRDKSSYIIDDDIGHLLERAHEASNSLRIYLIFDSCHSGTISRVEESKNWEEIDDDIASTFNVDNLTALNWPLSHPTLPLLSVSRQADDPREITNSLRDLNNTLMGYAADGNAPNSHILFSGCTMSQACKETIIDGDYHGIFTYMLTKAIYLNPAATCEDLYKLVCKNIPEIFNQNPQLEGPDSYRSRAIFS